MSAGQRKIFSGVWLSCPGTFAGNVLCAAVLAAETLGTMILWAPLPFAWIWIGGRVYSVTQSLFADGAVALLGFAVSAFVAMRALARLDQAWIALRRRAGYAQSQGVRVMRVVVGI